MSFVHNEMPSICIHKVLLMSVPVIMFLTNEKAIQRLYRAQRKFRKVIDRRELLVGYLDVKILVDGMQNT